MLILKRPACFGRFMTCRYETESIFISKSCAWVALHDPYDTDQDSFLFLFGVDGWVGWGERADLHIVSNN